MNSFERDEEKKRLDMLYVNKIKKDSINKIIKTVEKAREELIIPYKYRFKNMENYRSDIIDDYSKFYKLMIIRYLYRELFITLPDGNDRITNQLFYKIKFSYEDCLNSLNYHLLNH